MRPTYPPDLADRVTSLVREAGRDVEPWHVLAECMATLAHRWSEVRAGRVDGVLEEWRRRSPSARGARVEILTADGPRVGITRGLADDGALCVEADGVLTRVVAGEVQWL